MLATDVEEREAVKRQRTLDSVVKKPSTVSVEGEFSSTLYL